MFDRIGRLAEKTANSISRRSFLTRFGLMALGVVAMTGAGPQGPYPPNACILNGGCCGGANPYLKTNALGNPVACSPKSNCSYLIVCARSDCCNGSGACKTGKFCYANFSCGIPC